MKKTVCVLGEGAWGTAFATLLANNGHHVNLWCYDENVAHIIHETRVNSRYLPDVFLSDQIQPITNLSEALCGAEFVFEAIPVKFLRSVLEQAIHCFDAKQVWIVLSKGVEQNTLMLPSDIIDDCFKHQVKTAVFAGPSFASELARKKITAGDLASNDCNLLQDLKTLLKSSYFKPYCSSDPRGVQAGGALKNVIALAVGMLDGAGYTDNAKAFVISKGLEELAIFAELLGGKRTTIYGLSGVGDLVLTAMSAKSRNFEFGKAIGKGIPKDAIEQMMAHVAEGVNTVKSVHQIMKQQNVHLPISAGVYEVVFEGKSIGHMVEDLMKNP